MSDPRGLEFTGDNWCTWSYVRMHIDDMRMQVMRGDNVVTTKRAVGSWSRFRIFEAWRLGSILNLDDKFPSFNNSNDPRVWNKTGWTPWMYARVVEAEDVVQIVPGAGPQEIGPMMPSPNSKLK